MPGYQKEIENVLKAYESFLSETVFPRPYDDPSLKQAVLLLALKQEIEWLRSNNYEDERTFKENLKKRCQERNHSSSLLSFSVLSQSFRQSLYWEIITIVFRPQNMEEMFAIMFPEILWEVIYEIDKELPAANLKKANNPRLYLKKQALNWKVIPAEQSTLSHYAFANNCVFDHRNIDTFSFELHLQFYELLQQQEPEMANAVYTHNLALQTLKREIDRTKGYSPSPRKALIQLNTATSLKMLQAILFSLPKEKRLAAIQTRNRKNQTILDLIAFEPDPTVFESIIVILSLLPPADRLAVVQAKDIHGGGTILHRAVESPEMLQQILLSLSEGERLAALQTLDDHCTVLHGAAHNLESLKIILDALSEKERLAAVQTKDCLGSPLLYWTLEYPAQLKMVLSSLLQDDRFAAVQTAGYEGRTALHGSVRNVESLEIILSFLSKEERSLAVQVKNNKGQTVLHVAAEYPASLSFVLSALPQEIVETVLYTKDNSNETVLDMAISRSSLLKVILPFLSKEARCILTRQINDKGFMQSYLWDPKLLGELLSSLPQAEKFPVVQTKDGFGRTLLHWAVHHPNSLQVILSFLTLEEKLSALKSTDNNGFTVLKLARQFEKYYFNRGEAFQTIFESLATKDSYSRKNNDSLKEDKVSFEKSVHVLIQMHSSRLHQYFENIKKDFMYNDQTNRANDCL